MTFIIIPPSMPQVLPQQGEVGHTIDGPISLSGQACGIIGYTCMVNVARPCYEDHTMKTILWRPSGALVCVFKLTWPVSLSRPVAIELQVALVGHSSDPPISKFKP